MHNKVENTTTIKLPNSAWISFDSCPSLQPTLPPLLSSSSKSFNVQNSSCDGTKLAMYFIVSSLFAISLHWWQTERRTADGILKFTSRFPFSDYCRCAEVQFSVTHREESFLSVFPCLSNTRTLLGGEKGLRGFLNTLRQFIEDHEAHYSETPELSFTMHTSNAPLYICK